MEARERTIARVRELLERAGFVVSDAHGIRPTSFDLMVRRDSQLLILKVLKNIDALAPEEANRLRVLGELFHATPLILGEASGATMLESGVVYTRYGVPILTEESFGEYLLRGVPPFLFSSPGGVFARIDGSRLRELREARGLSLGALAGIAGVTRRTIQLYEDGGGAEISIVERIETYLHDTVVRPVEVFPVRPASPSKSADPAERESESAPPPRPPAQVLPTGDVLRDDVFRQLDTMGFRVVVTVRCPFDAFTHADARGEEEILLTGVGSLRSAANRAEVLQGLAQVIEGHSMFVTRDKTHRESIDGLPIITIRELHRHRDPDELVELLHEREGP
ncbi:MAG TPA: transcriptional regulator [Thermoplasmata archaeon]|nr:transcriptional regulator [Thermoplasmata archaeon]